METGPDIGQAVREELERVLSSTEFARSERLSRFLRFVVERHLEGRESELKESTIAVEVFGRKPDYDPKQDSTVRTEASRLRARLSKYYAGEGSRDPLVIELPKGGYIPVFGLAEAVARNQATPQGRPAACSPWQAWRPVTAAALWWWIQHKNAPIPIAVLPLINLSQDPANDYFADGLTGEIIRNLSIIDGLAVRSQTSSFAFKGKPRNVREAGKQLAADYILEGSVLRAGQQLRINAQLVRVRDDFPLWSGRYDRELTDVFAIQDEISRGIVNSLRLKLGRGRRRYETSVEAYDLYLRARSFEMLPALSGIDRSLGPFEQAIAKDPSFAPAYAGLAAAHAARSGFDDPVDRASEMSKGWAAAEKAIQLDPLLAEAHDALGMMRARDAQWEQSEKSFRRAIELAPATRCGTTISPPSFSCRSAGSRRRFGSCASRRNSIRFHPRCTSLCASRSGRRAGSMRRTPIAGRRRRTIGRRVNVRPRLCYARERSTRRFGFWRRGGVATSWRQARANLASPMRRPAAARTPSESRPLCRGPSKKRPSSPLWATRTARSKLWIARFRWARFGSEGTFS